jgi:hypothetical protein
LFEFLELAKLIDIHIVHLTLAVGQSTHIALVTTLDFRCFANETSSPLDPSRQPYHKASNQEILDLFIVASRNVFDKDKQQKFNMANSFMEQQ